MKIYYRYSNCDTLIPNRGDMINELGVVSALCKNNQVYYAGRRACTDGYGNMKLYESMQGKPDICYVRANKFDFNKFEGRKRIWMASPFNPITYRKANAISCFSEYWTKCLHTGHGLPGLNPEGVIYKKGIYVNQVVGKHFRPISGLRKDGVFTIGYFGRMKEKCYPTLLFSIWEPLLKYNKNVRLICGLNNGTLPPLENVDVKRFDYIKMHKVYNACDVVVESYSGVSWEFCGSISEKESISCGVPVISEESEARRNTFGPDYQLLMPRRSMGGTNPKHKELLVSKLIKLMDRAYWKQQSAYVYDKSRRFSIDQSALYFDKLFGSIK